MKKHPNLIKDMKITKPEQLWVSDITYNQTEQGHNYLSLITDAYSKKIVGYELLENLSMAGPLKALESALKNRKYSHHLIHHSDRDLQYCSAEYINKLKENNVKISMKENGDPYENSIAERVNGILKYEFLFIDGFKDHIEAIKVITESIRIYTNERPHLSCDMLTPNQSHLQQNEKMEEKSLESFYSRGLN